MADISTQPITINIHSQQLASSLEALRLADQSTPSSSFPSSPEIRPYDNRHSILEEEEETGSEAGNEPLTPVDPTTLVPHGVFEGLHGSRVSEPKTHLNMVPAQQPLYSAVSPPKIGKSEQNPITTTPKRQNSAPITEKPSAIKRVMSGLMKRTPSSTASKVSTQNNSPALSTNSGLNSPERRNSDKPSSPKKKSPTRQDTPPSREFPAEIGSPPRSQESARTDFPTHGRKKNRSTSGFGFRDKFSSNKNITFGPTEHEKHQEERRAHRTASVDLEPSLLEMAQRNNAGEAQSHLPAREVWDMLTDAGTGLKARRLSLSLPDDIVVDVSDLNQEYSEQHKLGLRGKAIGKGATSTVRLVSRKGHPSELYAAKEFRTQKKDERSEDYEKKVKSEFCIAKSLHHPNIVETFSLCTHSGRWTHVMEYCSEGDLFNLVSQKYLSKQAHLLDRICLFKQLIQGLNYLHCHGIAHRDVKLENLLITKEGKLKITDFGVSEVFAGVHPGVLSAQGQCGKEMGEVRLCHPGMCGSPPYVAPEVIAKNCDYDPRPLDVWGAAVVMLCMTANGVLWQDAKLGSSTAYDDLINGWNKWYSKHPEDDAIITEVDYPNVSFFDKCVNPPALRRLLLTMLNPDPAKRVTMSQVATNRWLKNAECCQPDSFDQPAQVIDASKSCTRIKNMVKLVQHNHLPPQHHFGHRLVRLPGSTAM